MAIEILQERASPRPKAGQPGALPWAGHAVSFEGLQKGPTMVDRQGSAAVLTEDSAAQNRRTWGGWDMGTWQWGEPIGIVGRKTVSGWYACLPVSPGPTPLALPQRTPDKGLVRLVPYHSRSRNTDFALLQRISKAQDPGFLHHCRLGQCDSNRQGFQSPQRQCHSEGVAASYGLVTT